MSLTALVATSEPAERRCTGTVFGRVWSRSRELRSEGEDGSGFGDGLYG